MRGKIFIEALLIVFLISFISATTNINNNLINTTGNVTASYLFGLLNWSDITNKFITSVDNIYIFMNGTKATFNETKLNSSIDSRVSLSNVNSSNFWDNLNTPIDITNLSAITMFGNLEISNTSPLLTLTNTGLDYMNITQDGTNTIFDPSSSTGYFGVNGRIRGIGATGVLELQSTDPVAVGSEIRFLRANSNQDWLISNDYSANGRNNFYLLNGNTSVVNWFADGNNFGIGNATINGSGYLTNAGLYYNISNDRVRLRTGLLLGNASISQNGTNIIYDSQEAGTGEHIFRGGSLVISSNGSLPSGTVSDIHFYRGVDDTVRFTFENPNNNTNSQVSFSFKDGGNEWIMYNKFSQGDALQFFSTTLNKMVMKLAKSGSYADMTVSDRIVLPTTGINGGLSMGGSVQAYVSGTNELSLWSGDNFKLQGGNMTVIGNINSSIYYGNGSLLTGILGSGINNNLNWINSTQIDGLFNSSSWNNTGSIINTRYNYPVKIQNTLMVGSATAVPSGIFEVQSTSGFIFLQDTDSSSNNTVGGIQIQNNANGNVGAFGKISTATSNIHISNQISGGGIILLTTNSLGNIGIDTNVPQYKLDVNGSINANGNGTIIGSINATGKAMINIPMGEIYTEGNTAVTVISAMNTFVEANITPSATFNSSMAYLFKNTSNSLTYNDDVSRICHMGATISISSEGANDVIQAKLYKNGVAITGSLIETKLFGVNDVSSTAIHTMPVLSKNDNVTLYVANTIDADDLTIKHMNMFAVCSNPM